MQTNNWTVSYLIWVKIQADQLLEPWKLLSSVWDVSLVLFIWVHFLSHPCGLLGRRWDEGDHKFPGKDGGFLCCAVIFKTSVRITLAPKPHIYFVCLRHGWTLTIYKILKATKFSYFCCICKNTYWHDEHYGVVTAQQRLMGVFPKQHSWLTWLWWTPLIWPSLLT